MKNMSKQKNNNKKPSSDFKVFQSFIRDAKEFQQGKGKALNPILAGHVYPLTRLPVCSGSMVEGSGAGRTWKLSHCHIVSGRAGDIIIGYNRGAHRLQCPVGGVLPVHAKRKGEDRVNGETNLILATKDRS